MDGKNFRTSKNKTNRQGFMNPATAWTNETPFGASNPTTDSGNGMTKA